MQHTDVVDLPLTIGGQSIIARTHREPHADELLPCVWAEMFATPQWVEQHCPKNILPLGIDGAEFDEHRRSGRPRLEGDTCATLVARSLAIDDDIHQPLITYIQREDLGGGGRTFDLPLTVKELNRRYPDRPDLVLNWTRLYFYGWLHRRLPPRGKPLPEPHPYSFTYQSVERALRRFLPESTAQIDLWRQIADTAWRIRKEEIAEATKLLMQRGKLLMTKDASKTERRVWVITSANERLGSVYYRPECQAADVLLRFVPLTREDRTEKLIGHFQIFSNQQSGMSVEPIIVALRKRLLRSRQTDYRIRRRTDLRDEGFIADIPELYYHRSAQSIFCGSRTNRKVPKISASTLTKEELIKIVLRGIRTMTPQPVNPPPTETAG